jgi:hypothetical protein
MPVTLAELSNAGRPQKNGKFTKIEDVFASAEQSVQQDGLQRFYHDINPQDPRAVFMKKLDYPGSTYSSDWTIPVMHAEFPEPPAQRFVDAARLAFPNANQVYDQDGNIIELPRTVSSGQVARDINKRLTQYAAFNTSPPIAGGVPMLKDATTLDHSILAGNIEPFRMQGACSGAIEHVMNCEFCKRHFGGDLKQYAVFLAVVLILIFVILFFLFKRPSYYY